MLPLCNWPGRGIMASFHYIGTLITRHWFAFLLVPCVSSVWAASNKLAIDIGPLHWHYTSGVLDKQYFCPHTNTPNTRNPDQSIVFYSGCPKLPLLHIVYQQTLKCCTSPTLSTCSVYPTAREDKYWHIPHIIGDLELSITKLCGVFLYLQ